MHSKDLLANELRAVGLTEMADRAAKGWYHDYISPLDAPAITLADDLAVAAKNDSPQRAAILKLRQRHLDGDFDATKEEADDWAKSPEGQETFGRLVRKE